MVIYKLSRSVRREAGVKVSVRTCLLVLFMGLIAISCSTSHGSAIMFTPNAPKRAMQVADPLIDETALSTVESEITYSRNRSPCVEGPGDEVWVKITPKNATTTSLRVAESICQYDKSQRASRQFDRLENLYIFPYSQTGTPPPPGFDTWEAPPTEISFASQYADKWRLGCQSDDRTGYWYRCRYFALYSEYLLEFSIWNDEQSTPDTFNLNELDSLLQLIDDKMAVYLGCK